jgi:hypothetical protein
MTPEQALDNLKNVAEAANKAGLLTLSEAVAVTQSLEILFNENLKKAKKDETS